MRDLEAHIAESRQLRTLVRDPDLVAVRIESTRRRTLAGLWFFLTLGLAFTTTGVHDFLAGDRLLDDPVWWAAWTVEPMFAGLLIVLLNFEATILAHGVNPASTWWRRIKTLLLSSTLFMNVIPQLAPLWGSGTVNIGSLAVHAIIPVVVYALAEVIPVIQARARTVILNGYAEADHHMMTEPEPDPTDTAEPSPVEPDSVESVPAAPASTEPAPERPTRPDVDSTREAVRTSSLKLPPPVMDKLHAARGQAAAEGRELTTTDVRQAVRVPDEMAARIVSELSGHNGHTFA